MQMLRNYTAELGSVPEDTDRGMRGTVTCNAEDRGLRRRAEGRRTDPGSRIHASHAGSISPALPAGPSANAGTGETTALITS
jgi:hypothetical protein